MSERFIAGTDIGGTFTDCVLIEPEMGRQYAGKAPTTPEDLSEGMLGSIRTALAAAGVAGDDGLGMIETLLHGTTVGTNAMVERKGAKTGAIVTKGHRDALSIMRVDGRVEGLPPGDVVRMQTTRKPEPLIPKQLIREVTERVDYQGAVVIPLQEDEVREQVSFLLEQGVTSIALMYLWCLRQPGPRAPHGRDHPRALARDRGQRLLGAGAAHRRVRAHGGGRRQRLRRACRAALPRPYEERTQRKASPESCSSCSAPGARCR